MSIPELVVSMLLFLILFFGIGFILNMLLRKTWVMSIVYPIVIILIIDKVRLFEYITKPSSSFTALKENFLALGGADVFILSAGFVGAVLSGIIIRVLRAKGYQMF